MRKENTALFKERLGIIVSLFVPLAPILYWYAISREYPRGDSASYAFHGMWSYQKFLSEGLIPALHELYWHRMWKPVIHTALAFPALLITKGDIRFAVALVNIGLFFVFLLFLRKIADIFLPPYRAILATWFVGTLPWVLLSATTFQCELPLLTFTMATLYFYLKCDDFKSIRHSLLFGISLGMAAISHPFLAIENFTVPLFFILWRAHHAGTIKLRDVILALPLLLLLFILFEIQTPWSQYGQPAFIASIVLLAPWLWTWKILVKKWGLSTPFYFFSSAALAIFLIWQGAFLRDLYEWLVATTFSPLAFHMGGQKNDMMGTFWTRIMGEFGTHFLPIIIAFLVISWSLAIFKNRYTGFKWEPLLVMLPLIIVPPLIGSRTYNGNPRYYYSCATLLFLFSTLQTLRLSRGRISWLIKFTFSIGAAASIIVSVSHVFDPPLQWREKLRNLIDYNRYYLVPPKTPESAVYFFDDFRRIANVKTGDAKDVALLVNGTSGWIPEESQLTLIGLEKGFQIYFWRPWVLYESPEKPPLQLIREKYSFIILNITGKADCADWEPLSYGITRDLLSRWKNGSLNETGMKTLGVLNLESHTSKFLILETNPSPSLNRNPSARSTNI